MKNQLFSTVTLLLSALVTPSVTSAAVTVPSGYQLVETSSLGSQIYKSTTGNLMYVIVVDTSKSDSHINFGGRSLSQVRKYYYYENGIKKTATRTMYTKQSVSSWFVNKYNNATINPPLSAFAVINAQFFGCPSMSYDTNMQSPIYNYAYCALSLPVRSSGSNGVNQIVSSDVDNTAPKRTVFIRKNKDTYIAEGYNSGDLTAWDTKELLVGLKNTINPTASIGRTYIGGVPYAGCNPDYTSMCKMQYLLFFVAQSETGDTTDQSGNIKIGTDGKPMFGTMTKKVIAWGISKNAIVAMDGSGSSQLKSSKAGFSGSDPNRAVPSVIVIK